MNPNGNNRNANSPAGSSEKNVGGKKKKDPVKEDISKHKDKSNSPKFETIPLKDESSEPDQGAPGGLKLARKSILIKHSKRSSESRPSGSKMKDKSSVPRVSFYIKGYNKLKLPGRASEMSGASVEERIKKVSMEEKEYAPYDAESEVDSDEERERILQEIEKRQLEAKDGKKKQKKPKGSFYDYMKKFCCV